MSCDHVAICTEPAARQNDAFARLYANVAGLCLHPDSRIFSGHAPKCINPKSARPHCHGYAESGRCC